MKKNYWLLTVIIWICAGCTSFDNEMAVQKKITLNDSLFTPINSVISEAELYQLTEQQQTSFLKYYNEQVLKGYLPHKAIWNFLESKLSNFTYYGKTYTASNAMLRNSGNCMSLAILTTAFARLVGVEIDYRKMHSLPVYEKHGNVILSSSHVQSLLYDPSFVVEDNYIYFSRPGITIDYFPQEGNIRSNKANSNEFLSMYYVNKAAELYIEKNFNSAFFYAKQAYDINSESLPAMNLLALLHKRKGDEVSAERLYLAAIASENHDVSILDNYVNLLKSQGKMRDAHKVKSRIESIYDPNPYHWLEKAQSSRYKHEYDDAERFYRKVIKLAPYVKQAYYELHEVYLLQGNKKQAISTLKRSLPWLNEPKQKIKYKKQLYQLSAAI